MRHQSRTWRKAHALKPTVEHPKHAERHNSGAETEAKIHCSGKNEPGDHVPTRVHAISDETIHKFRHTVDHPVQRKEHAQVSFSQSKLRFDAGHREADVFADEIKERVAD